MKLSPFEVGLFTLLGIIGALAVYGTWGGHFPESAERTAVRAAGWMLAEGPLEDKTVGDKSLPYESWHYVFTHPGTGKILKVTVNVESSSDSRAELEAKAELSAYKLALERLLGEKTHQQSPAKAGVR